MRAAKLYIPPHLEEIIRKVAENQASEAELQTLQSDLIQNSAIDGATIADFLLELNALEIKPQLASLLTSLHEHRRPVIAVILNRTKNPEQEKNSAQANFYCAYLLNLVDTSLEKRNARNYLRTAKELGHPAAEKALIKLEIAICLKILLKNRHTSEILTECANLLGINLANKKLDEMRELVILEMLRKGMANTEGKEAGLEYLSEYADFLRRIYEYDSLAVLIPHIYTEFRDFLSKLISAQKTHESQFSEPISRMIRTRAQILRNLQDTSLHRNYSMHELAVTLSDFSALFQTHENNDGPITEAIQLWNQLLKLKLTSDFRAHYLYNLSLVYLNKKAPGMDSNTPLAEADKLALPYLEEAAKLEHREANTIIANLYSQNQFPNLPPKTSLRERVRLALPYLERAAKKGCSSSIKRLVDIFSSKLAPGMNHDTPFHEAAKRLLPYLKLLHPKNAERWQSAYLDIRDKEAVRTKEEAIKNNPELKKLKSQIVALEKAANKLERNLYKNAFFGTPINKNPKEKDDDEVLFIGMGNSHDALNLDNLGALAIVKQEPAEEDDLLNEAGKRTPSPGLFPPPKDKEEADDSNRKRAKIDGPGI